MLAQTQTRVLTAQLSVSVRVTPTAPKSLNIKVCLIYGRPVALANLASKQNMPVASGSGTIDTNLPPSLPRLSPSPPHQAATHAPQEPPFTQTKKVPNGILDPPTPALPATIVRPDIPLITTTSEDGSATASSTSLAPVAAIPKTRGSFPYK